MPEHQQKHQSTESKSTAQKQATPRIQSPTSHPMAIIQRARINPKSLTPADVLQLQRTIGNRAVGRLLSEIGLIPSKAKQAPPVQRQELVQRQEIPEEEEPLQGMFEGKPEEETCPSCMQRQEIPEEEEPLQGKMVGAVQRQEIPEEEEPLQGMFTGTVQRQEIPEEEEPLQTKRENNTGMPDNLKAGVENLSGIDMSDVRVHYNSSKPANVGALAYAQGTNIHVAPGQEKHLPHEAWHVVQQKQGRVSPTGEAGGMPLNNSRTLESEADSMGWKVLQQYAQVEKPKESKSQSVANEVSQKRNGGESTFQFVDNRPEAVAQRKLQEMANNSPRAMQADVVQMKLLANGKLNVVGENHEESEKRRPAEIRISQEILRGGYWQEGDFKATQTWIDKLKDRETPNAAFADPLHLRVAHAIQILLKIVSNNLTQIIPEWKREKELPPIMQIGPDGQRTPLPRGEIAGEKLIEDILTQGQSFTLKVNGLLDNIIATSGEMNRNKGQLELLDRITKHLQLASIMWKQLVVSWQTLKVGDAVDDVVYAKTLQWARGYEELIGEWAGLASDLGGKTEAETRLKRSWSMHDVAESRSKDVGIWKVGEMHAKEMQYMGDGERDRNYELLSREEFNETYFPKR